jgi:hypothetical protein
LLFRERKKEEKKRHSSPAEVIAASLQHPGFQGCYVAKKANLKVNCTFCSFYVLVIYYLVEKPGCPILDTMNLKYSSGLKNSVVYQLSATLVSLLKKKVRQHFRKVE